MKRKVLYRYTGFKRVPPFGMRQPKLFVHHKIEACLESLLKYTAYLFKRFDLIFENPLKRPNTCCSLSLESESPFSSIEMEILYNEFYGNRIIYKDIGINTNI